MTLGRRHLACVRMGLHSFHLKGITESRVREFEGRQGILVMQPLRAHHMAHEAEEYPAMNESTTKRRKDTRFMPRHNGDSCRGIPEVGRGIKIEQH